MDDRRQSPPATVGGRATAREPQLERQSRRFEKSGLWFFGVTLAFAVPGIVLIVLGHTWVLVLGLAFAAVALVSAIVTVSLLLSGLVTYWAARRRPFA